MGKRKEREEFSRKRRVKFLYGDFDDVNVWIRRKEAALGFNKHNPNPTEECRESVDVNVLIHREAAALKSNKHNPNPNPNPAMESRILVFEPEVFDKIPEASRMKKYAIFALGKGKVMRDFELVQVGPLAVGDLSRSRRILHLNFKAKILSGGGDAAVLTYFSELTETIHSDHVSVLCCECLGPSKSLPEIANTCGCLYCSSCNIHHPVGSGSFQNGREPYEKALTSKLLAIREYLRLRKHKTKDAFIKRFPDPELEYFEETTEVPSEKETTEVPINYLYFEETTEVPSEKETTEVPIDYLYVALRIYNEKQGSNFELVKMGKYAAFCCALGIVYHMNFEARNKDDVDDAVVQTFFAQVIPCAQFFLVDFCSCLGPTYLLPDKADLQGCLICRGQADVHHPPGPGYLIGQ